MKLVHITVGHASYMVSLHYESVKILYHDHKATAWKIINFNGSWWINSMDPFSRS